MTAYERNEIIKRELMSADDSDTSVILDVRETSASIRNEHATNNFLKARTWWTHDDDETTIYVNPVLSKPYKVGINNVDSSEDFISALKIKVSDVLTKLRKDYE